MDQVYLVGMGNGSGNIPKLELDGLVQIFFILVQILFQNVVTGLSLIDCWSSWEWEREFLHRGWECCKDQIYTVFRTTEMFYKITLGFTFHGYFHVYEPLIFGIYPPPPKKIKKYITQCV